MFCGGKEKGHWSPPHSWLHPLCLYVVINKTHPVGPETIQVFLATVIRQWVIVHQSEKLKSPWTKWVVVVLVLSFLFSLLEDQNHGICSVKAFSLPSLYTLHCIMMLPQPPASSFLCTCWTIQQLKLKGTSEGRRIWFVLWCFVAFHVLPSGFWLTFCCDRKSKDVTKKADPDFGTGLKLPGVYSAAGFLNLMYAKQWKKTVYNLQITIIL